MTPIDHDELRTVDGGWCVPFDLPSLALYLATGICVGLSNEAN